MGAIVCSRLEQSRRQRKIFLVKNISIGCLNTNVLSISSWHGYLSIHCESYGVATWYLRLCIERLRPAWYHRNPWEYYTTPDANPPWLCPPPAERALRRSVQASLAREIPRRVGWTLGRRERRSTAVKLQYAQHRLYADSGSIASSAEEIMQQYQRRYGAWPYKNDAARDVYFLHDYPILCQTMEAISQRLPRSST